ncbi:MAG: DUF1707 and DUF2154 domain-containing protein [Spirochaetaceae bacterium]|nr:MAG: DUF1707 and DUF2154 domain-containing protein [Spirochaetaceae bacterium]
MSRKDADLIAGGDKLKNRQNEIIDLLTQCYADSYIDTEEFEQRVDQVNAAESIRRMELVIADLPAEYRLPLHQGSGTAASRTAAGHPAVAPANSLYTIMGDRRHGCEAVNLGLTHSLTVMGDTVFDLQDLPQDHGDILLQVTCIMGEVKIRVPKWMRVENSISSVLADVKVKGAGKEPFLSTLQVKGLAVMAEVSIRYDGR